MGIGFKLLLQINVHKRIHTEENIFQCNICGNNKHKNLLLELIDVCPVKSKFDSRAYILDPCIHKFFNVTFVQQHSKRMRFWKDIIGLILLKNLLNAKLARNHFQNQDNSKTMKGFILEKSHMNAKLARNQLSHPSLMFNLKSI